MTLALEEAKLAAEMKEVPVGAVIVDSDGAIVSRAHNLREMNQNALHHAELLAIESACRARSSWRLGGCTLYVTLEPCLMCTGAIVNSRISRVVYGVKDPNGGAMGSLFQVNAYPLNHKITVESGLYEEECSRLLSDFFGQRRIK